MSLDDGPKPTRTNWSLLHGKTDKLSSTEMDIAHEKAYWVLTAEHSDLPSYT